MHHTCSVPWPVKGGLSEPDCVRCDRFLLFSLLHSEVGSVKCMAAYFAKDPMDWGARRT